MRVTPTLTQSQINNVIRELQGTPRLTVEDYVQEQFDGLCDHLFDLDLKLRRSERGKYISVGVAGFLAVVALVGWLR